MFDAQKWVKNKLNKGYTPLSLMKAMNKRGIKISLSYICLLRDGKRQMSRKFEKEIKTKWN